MPEASLDARHRPGANNPPPTIEIPDEATLKDRHAALFQRVAAWKRRANTAAEKQPVTVEDCAILDKIFADGRDIANDADAIREKEKRPFLEAGRAIDGIFNGSIRDVIGADRKAGGLACDLLQKSADRRAAIAKAEQVAAAAEAERVAREAERVAQQAQRQEDKGQVRVADVTANRAEALQQEAGRLEAVAAAPVQELSRTRVGGVTSSVRMKLVCTGVVRDEIDLNLLRAYFKQDEIVAAVQKGLDMGAFRDAAGKITLKGAAVKEQAVGSVTRR